MKHIAWLILFGFVIQALFLQAGSLNATEIPVSGRIVEGYRVVSVSPGQEKIRITAYRGDYVRFRIDESLAGSVLSVPGLEIESTLTGDLKKDPFFKMKETGTFDFSLGPARGVLTVIDYHQSRYRELSTKEAAELIQTQNPLVLDVRTRKEYAQGHLAGSMLIPVQELQTRIGELSAYKDRDIVIYCATGNRSTVAAKLLIDAGFERVYNIRYGIADWWRNRLPIVR